MIVPYYYNESGMSAAAIGYNLLINFQGNNYLIFNPTFEPNHTPENVVYFNPDKESPEDLFAKIIQWEHRKKAWQRHAFHFDDSREDVIVMEGIVFPKGTWAEWKENVYLVNDDGKEEKFSHWLFSHPLYIPGDGLIISTGNFFKAAQEAHKWLETRIGTPIATSST